MQNKEQEKYKRRRS